MLRAIVATICVGLASVGATRHRGEARANTMPSVSAGVSSPVRGPRDGVAEATAVTTGRWENRCTTNAAGRKICNRVWVPGESVLAAAPVRRVVAAVAQPERSVVVRRARLRDRAPILRRTPLRHRIRFCPSCR